MKKWFHIISAVAVACALQARAALVEWEFDSADGDNLTKVYLSDQSTLISSGAGYVVSYWFFDAAANGGKGDYVPIGLGVTADVYAETPKGLGMFVWNSTPDKMPWDLLTNTNYNYAIRIFQDFDLVGSYGDPNVEDSAASFGRIDLSPAAIAKAWADAQTAWNMGVGGEIGDFEFTMKSTPGGAPGVLSSNSDWWQLADVVWTASPDGIGKYYLLAPVPEPSTWLLLGAGTAFIIIFRRRKA